LSHFRLKPGVYFLRLNGENKQTHTLKLLVQ
jgi:hypothetical protein